MNRFAILAVLAFVASASATAIPEEFLDEDFSKAIASPDDAEETRLLNGKLSNFNSFCFASRDWVFEDIKVSVDKLSSTVFLNFMQTAKEIGEATAQTANKATNRLGNQLLNSDAEVKNDLTADSDEDDEHIQTGLKEIAQTNSRAKKVVEAFKSVFIAMSSTVRRQVEQRLDRLTKMAGELSIEGTFDKVCEKVSFYEANIKRQFNDFVSNLPAEMRNKELSDIPCATSTKIVILGQVCSTVAIVKAPAAVFFKIFRLYRQNHPAEEMEDVKGLPYAGQESTVETETRHNRN